MLSFCLPMIVVAALATSPLGSGAVMMVTDVAGKVFQEPRIPIRFMDGLAASKAVTLAPGSRLALLDLATGVERVYLGPCRLVLDGAGRPSGARPVFSQRLEAAQGPLRLKPQNLVLAGVVMRGADAALEAARLEVIPCGPVVLERSPLLTWTEPWPAAQTRFRLYDEVGTLVQEATVTGASIRMPPLVPGKPYTWTLEAVLPGHPPRGASGMVRVLDDQRQGELAKVRPAATAPFAERLVFAALLEDLGLRGEAHPWWQALARERPREGRLQDLARR